MKKIKKVKIPAKEREISEYSCDICKKEMASYYESICDYYERKESRIFYMEGAFYPEGGSGEGEEFHICSECTKNKIFPLIKTHFKIKSTRYELDI